MNISDEAVEAAAARLIEAMSRDRGMESPYIDAEYPEDAVIDGRFDLPAIVKEILEAAAPHLTALRIITTIEELEALPAGSVVMWFDVDGEQVVSSKSGYRGEWLQTGTGDGWQADGIISGCSGSVTVLHEPMPTLRK